MTWEGIAYAALVGTFVIAAVLFVNWVWPNDD